MAKCGEDSRDVNIYVNTEIEMKKLRFHVPDIEGKSKCHTLHIGKKQMDCQELKVHGCPMEKVESDTYLGDILSSNGKNTTNIENIVGKSVTFGKHYFEIARTLRESMLVNGLLTNCEVWHNLKEADVKKLEEVDRLLL